MNAEFPVSPAFAPKSARRGRGAFDALDRLVLHELSKVAGRTRRSDTPRPEVVAASDAVLPHQAESAPAAPPPLDDAARKFVARCARWLALRSDATVVLDALARTLAEGAARSAGDEPPSTPQDVDAPAS